MERFCRTVLMDEPGDVEAAGTATLGADLCTLPGVPPPENPLVRQGLRRPGRRLCLQPDRPDTRLHPRGGAARRDGGGSYRCADRCEDDPARGYGRVPGESPPGGRGREAREPRCRGGCRCCLAAVRRA